MGCCGSKQFEKNGQGGGGGGQKASPEELRQKALDAAEERRKQSEMRGIQNPKTAQKLRAEQGIRSAAPAAQSAEVRHNNQVARDWAN
mmetsp:Transcript_222/g.389  ORF Transcript_222/g.389 Transcript_222/m.389 type:complete len:88 (+) Transcript_222:367-630(+)|eukprot:CAMPEP_0198205552 /NCGR_PEP_ID=MMETSP1445-20131203/9094_1 /TAXON_ID=36898 /ORGANISM="Pyramimonas sp., Strain CCMP2087" /LENGTH=87 /DNA_ID=CAMNT_0043877899 /DNA_START=317 /DNA_END=583 /DNA_ORIENTATION=+